MNRERTLARDVVATQIPSGDKQTLPQHARVFLHQTLGGSYTVQTDFGLFRIDGRDGDALGEQVAAAAVAAPTLADGAPDPEAIWAQLRQVYDPEIPVNIVDLGLVYDMGIEDLSTGNKKVFVKMTLTAPGCGMGATIAGDAQQKLLMLPGVEDASVEIVWEPLWHQSMITAEGRRILGIE